MLHEAREDGTDGERVPSTGTHAAAPAGDAPPAASGEGDERGVPAGDRQDDLVPARRAGLLGSTRSRMVLVYLVLLVVTGAVAVLGIHQVLLARLEARTEAALDQEVAEVRTLIRRGRDPSTGLPFASLEGAFDVYMERNVPSPEEAFVTFLDGRLHRDRLRSFPGRELPGSALARWADFSVSDGPEDSAGTFDTAHGSAKYRAVRFTVGDDRGAFVVTIVPAAGRREIQELQTYGVAVMLAALTVAAVCAWFLAGRVLAPVRDLTRTARSISESDRTARIRVAGSSEAAEMASTFNAMLDRLDAAHRSQVAFVRAAGHELRTPLTVVSGHLELLGDDEEERRTVMPLVLDELSRMGRLVDDLQSLIEAEAPDFLELAAIDAEALAHELVTKASALGDRTWRLDGSPAGTFVADKHRLTEAVLNLADNAVKHTGEGGEVGLGVELTADQVRIWVRDAGIGVPPGDGDRIFHRFARGQGAARRYRGAGLGLAIVTSIADAHGGHVLLADEPGAGTRFTIVIPRRWA